MSRTSATVTSDGSGDPCLGSSGQRLPPDHYLVPCRYDKFPSINDLNKTFVGNVSDLFYGRLWRKHALRVRSDEQPGNRMMVLKHFKQQMESEDVIAWGLDNNLVPAMGHSEGLDFQVANPDLQFEFPIVSLGSFVVDDSFSRHVAVLHARYDKHPSLCADWFDLGWHASNRFLFLSK